MTEPDQWPYWEAVFDTDGDINSADKSNLVDAVGGASLTDLIVFSHGWNNDQNGARSLYRRWFEIQRPLLVADANKRVGTIGVIWPSMRWPDEPIADVDSDSGGMASVGGQRAVGDAGGEDVRAVITVYPQQRQKEILEELAELLDSPPLTDDEADEALTRMHALMRRLSNTETSDGSAEDSGELAMLQENPRALAARFTAAVEGAASAPADSDAGGVAAVGLVDASLAPFGGDDGPASLKLSPRRLWAGAKEALRQLTYWQMKQRAGTIGQHGLGPLLRDLTVLGSPRIHLIGHSFGARLGSFALLALPEGEASPVHSLTLLQGAFSHSSFAKRLPHDENRSGALAGQEKKVRGPITVCFSPFDSAVGTFYPLASMASGQDAAALPFVQGRWGGMGYDGAQGVEAKRLTLVAGTLTFDPAAPGFLNVNAADVIRAGGPPSGAHSDIFHPELAALHLSAAGLR